MPAWLVGLLLVTLAVVLGAGLGFLFARRSGL